MKIFKVLVLAITILIFQTTFAENNHTLKNDNYPELIQVNNIEFIAEFNGNYNDVVFSYNAAEYTCVIYVAVNGTMTRYEGHSDSSFLNACDDAFRQAKEQL